MERSILKNFPTEKEIDSLLDKGAEIEIYMKDGKITMDIGSENAL